MDRERPTSSYLLVHHPNACNVQGQAGARPRHWGQNLGHGWQKPCLCQRCCLPGPQGPKLLDCPSFNHSSLFKQTPPLTIRNAEMLIQDK